MREGENERNRQESERGKKEKRETDGENKKTTTEHFGLLFWTLGEISRASSANPVSDRELL